ncbi:MULTISPECIES: adenine phosphoribosyltransferase [Arthrobacter]|uniref:adenine phosphoribosyltransferase n=1 Tax=Arthrobacter TaxID=1663 RepID=UPI000535D166|nr:MULTISPECIES: adenine phosphoribosyltransferase [Arthrobacter]AIY03960.1 adenine phosphoribosyltransferase [Arthrobacter sp. PAMC 25486]
MNETLIAPETPFARNPETANVRHVSAVIEQLCATVPDYPSPGIVFKDLTPVFADGAALKLVVDSIVSNFAGKFDAVAGVEARGFLLAAAAAYATGTGVITIRKAGKLPRDVYAESYALEYGEATLELHQDDVPVGTRVLILDDVLATGGTLGAAATLLERTGAVVAGIGVVLEIDALPGRDNLAGRDVVSLLHV